LSISLRYTVVFDGSCQICSRLAGVLGEWDHGRLLEILPSHSPGLSERFPSIPAGRYAEALQLIGPDGQTWEGAAAIEEIVRVLPKGRMIAWVFRIPFGRRLADRFYRWFARNRYRLGCGKHCPTDR